jgi:CDP-glucose 4,6-dehydratase
VNLPFTQLRGKRVFLSGHTGFKGAWMLPLLGELGCEVLAVSLPPETTPSMFNLTGGESLCRSVFADLRDRQRLIDLVGEFRPDVVIHLAAQSLVRRSYRDPIDTFESNVVGTMNVLEAIRQSTHPMAAVMITTDKVYAESKTPHAYAEDDKLGGHDPYSTSKAMCELLIDSYRKSFFHPDKNATHGKAIASARAGNVIGGGDWCEDRLIPDVVRAMSAGQSVRIRNPRSTRPWQHVLEPLCGYLTLADRLLADPARFARSFNFGPALQDVLEVETVVQLALKAWGSGRYHIDVDPNAPHEAGFLQISSDLAAGELGWRPRWSASTAITRTIEWYRHATADPIGYTRGQIREYFST